MEEADAEVLEKAHQLINRINNLVNVVGWQAAHTHQQNDLHNVRRVLVIGLNSSSRLRYHNEHRIS